MTLTYTPKQSEFNLRLVAAAPELLAALELLCKDYCPACGCDKHNTAGCYHCSLITRGQAVIRKVYTERSDQ